DGAQLTPQLLRNASFDSPIAFTWQLDSATHTAALLRSGSGAWEGPAYLEATAGLSGGSLYQDVAVAVTPNQDASFSVMVRARGAPVSGSLVLWGLGTNPTESAGTPFVAGPDWTPVTVTLDPLEAHATLRAQLYLATTNTFLDLDA